MRRPVFVLCSGVLGISLIDGGSLARPAEFRPAPARVAAESGLVIVPAGTTVLTLLDRELPVKSARPGDSIYFRVAAAVRVDTQTVIPTGSLIQATLSSIAERSAPERRFELTVRFRQLLKPGGAVSDVFVIARAPDDTTYRRGAISFAEVVVPSDSRSVLPRGSAISLVMRSAFTLDSRRFIASAWEEPSSASSRSAVRR